MEFFYVNCLLAFCLTIIVVLHFLFSKENYPNLPPGRMDLPVIGESLESLSTGRNGHPEKFYLDRVVKYSSNVFITSIFMEPVVVFGGAACNEFLFTNEDKLVESWWPKSVYKIFPSSAQTSSKDEPKMLRKIIVPRLLKPGALQKDICVMDIIAKRHFAMERENKEQVIVFPLAKRFTFWLACKLFLSIDNPADGAKLGEKFETLASGVIAIPIDFPGTTFYNGIKASKSLRKELTAIIKKRKTNLAKATSSTQAQDLLSHMLFVTSEDGKHMNESDIADKILGLLIGNHDTASAACTFIVKYLAEFPHIYDKVYEEQMEIAKSKAPNDVLNWHDIQKMKYSLNVAWEVMRLAPPVQGAFKEAISNFNYNGFTTPKGWKLYWSAHSTHMSAECFPEPEKFVPSRFEGAGPAPYTYAPFGGGPRSCPGREYARLELLVFMHNLVKRFKFEKLIEDEGIVVDPLPMPAKGLPIRLYSHMTST